MSDQNNSTRPPSGTKQGRGSRRSDTVAVALKYESGGEDAPKVTAGGRGAIAEQILEIAFATGVKVREDADLAEMLSAIDIDAEIPVEAFAAVAEILTYVYRANGTLSDIIDPSGGDDGAADAAR
ncbi:MAG: EscU/YscU/HrcU family type III secretion system export apparatus switch protein [Alphaproteobacteria bacterium]